MEGDLLTSTLSESSKKSRLHLNTYVSVLPGVQGQRQTAVTVCFTSNQLLLFVFVWQDCVTTTM